MSRLLKHRAHIPILAIAIAMAAPGVLSAQTVVVMKGEFLLDNLSSAKERSESDAKLIANRIAEALIGKDRTVVRVDEQCRSQAHLKETALREQADEAMCINTTQVGETYDIALLSTKGAIAEEQYLGPFSGALDVVSKLIAKALSSDEEPVDATGASPSSEADLIEPDNAPLIKDTADSPPPLEEKRRNLTPKTWALLAATGATALGFGIVEGIAYRKRVSYKDDSFRSAKEYDNSRAWQWAGRGLLFTTVALAVAAGAFLGADLHSAEKKRQKLTLLPGTNGEETMMVLRGSF